MDAIVQEQKYEIYCDLDGVLVDFEKGVIDHLGVESSSISKSELFKRIFKIPTFFLNLEWLTNGAELWQLITPHNPIILTGLPGRGWLGDRNKRHKRQWVSSNLGEQVPCIVVPSVDKQLHSGPTKILIDDQLRNIAQWEAKGGIGILYDHNQFDAALEGLKDLGIQN